MSFEEINIRIAEFIRINRESKNLSYRDICSKSKIAIGNLSKLEGSSGFHNNPTLKTIYEACNAVDKNLFDLFNYVYCLSTKENEKLKKE
ncbi:MAG: helix-turn-helix domain-containing protein [Alphaproteobacteria bacterium]|nr:helix-turn-helix domain-containing protein [Alphaproteobacteria bacterium]